MEVEDRKEKIIRWKSLTARLKRGRGEKKVTCVKPVLDRFSALTASFSCLTTALNSPSDASFMPFGVFLLLLFVPRPPSSSERSLSSSSGPLGKRSSSFSSSSPSLSSSLAEDGRISAWWQNARIVMSFLAVERLLPLFTANT